MKRLIALTIGCMAFGCGGGATSGGSSTMDINIGGKASTLAIKSSGSNKTVKTFTDASGKMTTATSFHATMANYDLDTTNGSTMRKPLTAPEQVRLSLQLVGAEGTDQNGELKPGVYKADAKEKFMKVDSLMVSTFADGKETNTNFETQFSASKITGQVEVTSVTADAISGKIDVTDGDKSVKGNFTANIAKKP